MGHIDHNPIEYLSAPSGEARDVYIPEAEFELLLKHTRDEQLKKLMLVTYEIGCRPQESLRLEIRHVDLDNRRWVFPRQEAKGKKAPRVIYLTDRAFEITRELIAGRTTGHVFLDSKNRPWTPAKTNSILKRVRVAMGKEVIKAKGIVIGEEEINQMAATINPTRMAKGKRVKRTKAELRTQAKAKLIRQKCKELVPSYSLYALRHTWATNALKSGLDALTVAILMGHQDPSMLAKVYQHLSHSPQHMLAQAKRAVGE
ncbi:MAG: tyrosine-type recombinase/integrase [Pirellulaceae bacterium]|nr:tyrosine-type recombinase/integrase [Pirellulaceae bacterium]